MHFPRRVIDEPLICLWPLPPVFAFFSHTSRHNTSLMERFLALRRKKREGKWKSPSLSTSPTACHIIYSTYTLMLVPSQKRSHYVLNFKKRCNIQTTHRICSGAALNKLLWTIAATEQVNGKMLHSAWGETGKKWCIWNLQSNSHEYIKDRTRSMFSKILVKNAIQVQFSVLLF